MKAYQPLPCDLYDYLEIACLYGYRLHLELLDGSTLKAQAQTTRTSNTDEWLVLQSDSGPLEIRLDQLLAITPLDEHARFDRIELAQRSCSN